jgi:hypothetical protein
VTAKAINSEFIMALLPLVLLEPLAALVGVAASAAGLARRHCWSDFHERAAAPDTPAAA